MMVGQGWREWPGLSEMGSLGFGLLGFEAVGVNAHWGRLGWLGRGVGSMMGGISGAVWRWNIPWACKVVVGRVIILGCEGARW